MKNLAVKVTCTCIALLLFASTSSAGLLDHGLTVEGERILRKGMWRLKTSLNLEKNAKPARESVTQRTVSIDTLRLPVSIRYGVNERIEAGIDFQLEQDHGLTVGSARIFDASGLSHLDAVGKFKIFPWTTMKATLSIMGDDALYYGSGGVDLGLEALLTLPINFPVPFPNVSHINVGYRHKSGSPDIDDNGIADARKYINTMWLAGSLIISPKENWAVVTEVFASRSPYNLEEFSDISLGVRCGVTDRTTLWSSVGHQLSDGSPEWAFKFGVETEFGSIMDKLMKAREWPKKQFEEFPTENPPELEISVTTLSATAFEAYENRDFPVALDAFIALSSRMPSDGRIYYNIGICYYNMKEYRMAEGAFNKASVLMPKDPDIYLYLGHSQFLQGNEKAARSQWRKVLSLDPNNELANFLLKTSEESAPKRSTW